MKKLIILAMLLILPISLVGCGKDDTAGGSNDELFSGTLQELIDGEKSMKCTYSIDSEGASGEGVVYVDGQKSYTEMVIENEGESMTTYMISDSEWLYTWSSMMPEQGMKMNLEKMKQLGEEFEQGQEAGQFDYEENFEQDFDFKCQSWIPDKSKFIPPSNVTFTDWTQTMETLSEDLSSMQESLKDLCDTCNILSGQEKADCLKNLGCE